MPPTLHLRTVIPLQVPRPISISPRMHISSSLLRSTPVRASILGVALAAAAYSITRRSASTSSNTTSTSTGSSSSSSSGIMSALTINSTVKLNSGYEIPRLGFGVFQIPNKDAKAAVETALKVGYRHIDSATYYENEEGVGAAVLGSGLKREDVFVTSKILSMQQTYASTIAGVKTSLAKSKLDYFDLYLVHDPLSGKETRIAQYKALLEAKEQGLVRSVGVSNFGIRHLQELEEAGLPPPAINQVELHPYCQQRPLVAHCLSKGTIVQAYGPLVRGKIAPHDALSEVAKAHSAAGKSVFQVLVRWSLQKGHVPLPKSVTPSRIESNADVFDFELSEEEMAKIDALDKGDDGAVNWNPINAP